MNTEEIHEQHKTVLSTGIRLSEARKKLGFSQQYVAERLCLKVSTIRDIEEDRIPVDLALTFLRGYIRSYAKLVHLPEEELMPIIDKQQALISAPKITTMKSLSLDKKHKDYDNLLISFTWLVIFVVIILTGIWWWQNYKVQYEETINIMNQSATKSNTIHNNNKNITNNISNNDNLLTNEAQTTTYAARSSKSIETTHMRWPVTVANKLQESKHDGVNSSLQIMDINIASEDKHKISNKDIANGTQISKDQNYIKNSSLNSSLNMNFTDNCWIEVIDAKGKKLFSGLQYKDNSLNLIGQSPYKLIIGAPAAVQIRYSGKLVDLSSFTKSNHVAHLILNTE